MLAIERACQIVTDADALVISAGAGIGVDSGLPDFRGNTGFWNSYPALAHSGIKFSDIANPAMFDSNPALAWGFYGHRLALYRQTMPHVGFSILNNWMRAKHCGGWIFTSNVDGQFQKAGFDGLMIRECHGSIHHLQCERDCRNLVWTAGSFAPEVDIERCALLNPPPTCPICGAMARPNVLMFNDWSWANSRTEEQRQCELKWLSTIKQSGAKVAVIEIGAGTSIPSVRNFSDMLTRHLNAVLIRINVRESAVERACDIGLNMSAKEALLAMQASMCS